MRLPEHLTALLLFVHALVLGGRRKPDVLRAGIVGMRGSTVLKTTGIHDMSTGSERVERSSEAPKALTLPLPRQDKQNKTMKYIGKNVVSTRMLDVPL